MNNTMPTEGIDSKTIIVIKRNDNIHALSCDDIFKIDESDYGRWVKVKNVFTVGFNNSFVEIDGVFYRKPNLYEDFVEVVSTYSRRVKVTKDYPIVIIDTYKTMITTRSASSLIDKKCNVPLGKTLQISQSFASCSVGKGICALLNSNKAFDLKSCFVSEPLKLAFCSETSSEDSIVSIRLKDKYRPYFQTAAGILLHT